MEDIIDGGLVIIGVSIAQENFGKFVTLLSISTYSVILAKCITWVGVPLVFMSTLLVLGVKLEFNNFSNWEVDTSLQFVGWIEKFCLEHVASESRESGSLVGVK